MKNTFIAAQLAAVMALMALGAAQAFADCNAPGKAPDVPDGNTASPDDILKAQQAVVAFQDATNTYVACLKKQHDDAITAAGPSISSSQADKIDKDESSARNAAVAQLNDVARRFNQSVQTFKDKTAAAKKAADDKANSKGKGK